MKSNIFTQQVYQLSIPRETISREYFSKLPEVLLIRTLISTPR